VSLNPLRTVPALPVGTHAPDRSHSISPLTVRPTAWSLLRR
jgi:hypothetical protein